MEIIIELFLQVFFELFIQLGAELLAEFGFRKFRKRKRPLNPWWAAFGYLLAGSILGGISLIFFKHPMIESPILRIVNLIATPIAAGFFMSFIGSIRQKKNQEIIRLDTFSYGFIFAFGMALIRFLFATT